MGYGSTAYCGVAVHMSAASIFLDMLSNMYKRMSSKKTSTASMSQSEASQTSQIAKPGQSSNVSNGRTIEASNRMSQASQDH